MRLPESILKRMRGPLVAATLAGCSSSPVAVEPEPIEAPLEPAPAAIVEPSVAYDEDAERERLMRLDRERAADEHRRDERIALREAAERRREAASRPRPDLDHILIACGRG